mgnify:CR=1 FL=1
MKWCLPAFATSLVVFLLLFAAIDMRRASTEARDASLIVPLPGDRPLAGESTETESTGTESTGTGSTGTESTETESTDETEGDMNPSFGDRARSGSQEPSVTTISPPARTMPPATALVFERRLEAEFLTPLRVRRDSLFARKLYSRAAPRVRSYDFTRIMVPAEHADSAAAAFVITGEEARLLLVRLEASGASFEVAGVSPAWSSAPECLEGFPGTLAALPLAPQESGRRRSTGPFYEEVRQAELIQPLEKRAETLRFEGLLSRRAPAVSSFSICAVADATAWPSDADGAYELIAGEELGRTFEAGGEWEGKRLRVPVRFDVNGGSMQVHFDGAWQTARDWASKIQIEYGFVDPGPETPAGSHQFKAVWSLKSSG